MRIAAFVLSVLLTSQAFAACPKEETQRPIKEFEQAGTLLFIVDNCTGKPASYVYGTVHSDAENIRIVAAPAFEKVQEVSAVGFEYVTPANATDIAAQAMYLPAQAPAILPNILSAKDYQALLKVMVDGRKMEAKVVERMRPWAVAVLMQMPANSGDGVILDDRLKRTAEASKKNIFGLETMQEQLQLFERMPAAMQVTLLKETLKDQEKIDVINALLQDAYLSKNLEALRALGDESFASIRDKELREYMREELLTKRNHHMTQRFLPMLKNGDAMIAVGALHLTGEEGVLNLLQQAGYRVVAFVPERYAKANRQ